MSASVGLCGVCCREIQMKRDGTLRAHLAGTSAAGRRQQCDGSGMRSARLELMPGQPVAAPEIPFMSRAAAFNARGEWHKVDALYAEYQDMAATGCASAAALDRQADAVNRALDSAEGLARWWDVAHISAEGRES